MVEKTAPLHTAAPVTGVHARPRRPLRRRILRGIGFALGGLVLLVVLVLAFLQTPWGKSIVRGIVADKLAGKINGTVKLGSIDYSFLFHDIELGGIEIRDAAGQPAAKVASLAVTIDRGSLIKGSPVIDRLAIRGLDVNVVQHADGTTNLDTLAKPAGGAPLDRIRVRAIDVAGAATITKPDGTIVAVTDLAVHGSLDARPARKELDLALAQIGANIAITPPQAATRRIALAIGDVKVGKRTNAIDVDVTKLSAGAVAIDSLGAHVRLDGKQLHGDQAITLAGVHVDSRQLSELLGKEVVVNDVAIQASVTGPENHLVLDGSVRTGGATLALTGTVDASTPARPSYQVSLRGTGLRSDLVKSEKPLPAVDSGIQIDVAGSGVMLSDLDATVNITVGPTTVDKIAVDGLTVKATARHATYSLEQLHASAPGVTIDAAGSVAADHTLDGTLTVHGEPREVAKTLEAAGIVLPRRMPPLPPSVELAVTAHGNLDGTVAVELAPTTIAVARGSISLAGTARLAGKQMQSAHTSVGLHGLDLAALAKLAGKPAKVGGSLSGTIEINATSTTRKAAFDLAVGVDKPALAVAVTGTADERRATATVKAMRKSDRSVIATIAAQLPLGKRDGKPVLRKTGAWSVDVDVERRAIGELIALMPEPPARPIPPGNVEAHIALAGTPAQPTGTIDVVANVDKLPHATQKVTLHTDLTSSAKGSTLATTGSIWLDATRDVVATIAATVVTPPVLAGTKPDLAALRAGSTIDATIAIPERDLATLAYLQPKLAELGGKLVGTISVTGTPVAPKLDATVRVHDYATATGAAGETTLTATGTPTAIAVAIHHGDGIAITADVDLGTKGRVAITAKARADHAPVLAALPAFIAGKVKGQDPGSLSWNMDGTVALVDGKLASAAVTGTLDVTGAALKLPHTDRRYHDIALAVKAAPTGLTIESLAAHESDVEVADRTLTATGSVTWDSLLHPTAAHLDLAADHWLVFGSASGPLGPIDAPHAAADFAIGVDADLTAPIPAIDATVHSLALHNPDRLDRAHQPEAVSVSGDVIFLGPGSGPVGKLPVAVAAAAEGGGEADAGAKPGHRKPLDIRVHIPDPIRLNQTPFDVMATGELTITVRDSGVAERGTLTMHSGTLSLFGQTHQLVKGTVAFTDEHPHGWMDMTFEHALPDVVMRELSKASAGGGARVTFVGSPTKPKTSLSGAANVALAEVMAMDEAGRPVYPSAPGLPASSTVTAPRGDQLLMLTFMATNLPHLIFLDRITAYADPYHDDRSYGRIENVEADHYTKHSRVRAVTRPPTPGRSSAELQWDRLFINDDQTAMGVGIRAGSRLGGGVGVFVEWSSKN